MRIGGFVQWIILSTDSPVEWTTTGGGRQDRIGQSLFVLTIGKP
jgi:hypothetical protein